MELLNQYANVVVAALAVLVLLILVLWIWRLYSQRVRGRRGQRLGVSEFHELDQTRRLVLVRRDEVEHLLLIGGPADIVVESGIGIAGHPSIAPASEDAGEARRPVAMRPAPRAPVFAERKPPPLRPAERVEPPISGPHSRDGDQS
ncbi:MAG: flagellar biosynthetic protein FliO [Rhizobiales bacterium]|nr:flagellar biosynthetic protein FliO [Hyphomicrobiales bacterium]MBI3674323.1 flagellar biosynthetic protein FliO [Hyphomicrobiales bacterium]